MNSSTKHVGWCWALLLSGGFFAAWWIPEDLPHFHQGFHEALVLSPWYARERVELCLLPARLHCRADRRLRQSELGDELPRRGENRIDAYEVASVS